MYARILETGEVEAAPSILYTDDEVIINPTEEMLIANGYKYVEESEFEPMDGYYGVANYIELDDKIVMTWDYKKQPMPHKTIEEQLDELREQNQMLIDCILEMAEIIYG